MRSALDRPGAVSLGFLLPIPCPCVWIRISQHPDSYGFPQNHPPMTSFLGVPLKVRDEIYGNLYLTDKIGAERFSDEDEALAEALALATGVAIQNYRLHDRVRALSVLDDRDRIARDLHDRVIQRIYAVGMSLAGAAGSTISRWCTNAWSVPSMNSTPRSPISGPPSSSWARRRCRTACVTRWPDWPTS